ncbi:hypothetical protein [Pseudomonas sp. LP_7_YM]|nr:hypothetical protein [Pseudomonas sp. LP_7_YM]
MLSHIVDHYDKRNNERSYRRFHYYVQMIACILGLTAVLSPLLNML